MVNSHHPLAPLAQFLPYSSSSHSKTFKLLNIIFTLKNHSKVQHCRATLSSFLIGNLHLEQLVLALNWPVLFKGTPCSAQMELRNKHGAGGCSVEKISEKNLKAQCLAIGFVHCWNLPRWHPMQALLLILSVWNGTEPNTVSLPNFHGGQFSVSFSVFQG